MHEEFAAAVAGLNFHWGESNRAPVSEAICNHNAFVCCLLRRAQHVTSVQAAAMQTRSRTKQVPASQTPVQTAKPAAKPATRPSAKAAAKAAAPTDTPAEGVDEQAPMQDAEQGQDPQQPPAEHDILSEIQAGYLTDPAFGDPADAAKQYSHMHAVNGLWMHHSGAIALPQVGDLRTRIMAELHERMYAGHPGEKRTIMLVKRYFWWPTMDQDCRTFVKGCQTCQRDKSSTQKPAGLLQQPEMAEGKWQTVSLDYITSMPLTSRGHDMICTVVDTFTKMTHLIPCHHSLDGAGAAQLLWQHVFSKHGVPKKLISDRDTRFTSEMFKGIMKIIGTQQAMSTAFHPQTDGQTERMNRVVEEMLRHYVNSRQDDWDVLLACAEFAINNQWQASIQTTPFHLNYGYHPTLPVDLALSDSELAQAFVQEKQSLVRTGGKYFRFAMQRFNEEALTALVDTAKRMLQGAGERQKGYADKHRRALEFEPGQEVMLNTKHLTVTSVPSKKLFPKWLGPMTVDEKISPNAYRLRIPGRWQMNNSFNVSLLKPWHDNGRPDPPPAWTLRAGQDYEFEVDRILDHYPKEVEVRKGMSQKALRRMQFLVRWRFYGPDFDTWEPYICLKNAPESLTEYGL